MIQNCIDELDDKDIPSAIETNPELFKVWNPTVALPAHRGNPDVLMKGIKALNVDFIRDLPNVQRPRCVDRLLALLLKTGMSLKNESGTKIRDRAMQSLFEREANVHRGHQPHDRHDGVFLKILGKVPPALAGRGQRS